jgi:hypothetical protein
MTNLTQPSLSERLNRDRATRDPRSFERAEMPGTTATLTHGKSPATPFLALGTVALFVFAAVAVVTLAAVLVWWLV